MLVLGRRVDSAPLVLIGLLTVLPAVWLALAGLVSLAALLPRPEPRRLGLAALWWAAFGWTWGLPALPGGEPVVAPIRVLSWNVQRLLFEDDDQGTALACVADGVRRAAPDVLVLLEVSARDVERLADRLGLDCAQADYTGSGDPRHGGLAVCVDSRRWGLARRSARRFTEDRAWYYLFAEIEERPPAEAPRPRVDAGLSAADEDGWGAPPARAPGQRVFNVLAAHLHPYRLDPPDEVGDLSDPRADAVTDAQGAEAAALLRRVQRLDDPTLVAGDFNSARDTSLHLGLRRVLRDVHDVAGGRPRPTVKALGRLPVKVDYIYATPDIAVSAAAVGDEACADHRPVSAVVGLPAPRVR